MSGEGFRKRLDEISRLGKVRREARRVGSDRKPRDAISLLMDHFTETFAVGQFTGKQTSDNSFLEGTVRLT